MTISKSPRRWVAVLLRSIPSLALLAVGIVVFVNLGRIQPVEPERTRATLPVIETAVVVRHDDGVEFEVNGVVTPLREIEIAAEVAGRILHKADQCRVGRYVNEGDLLMRIDPREYEIEKTRLRLEVAQAQGSLDELDADISSNKNLAQLSRDELIIRQRELSRLMKAGDSRVFSDTEIDVAKRNELLTRASLQSLIDQSSMLTAKRKRLESTRDIVRTRLEKAELDLQRTEIHATISGVLTQVYVEQDGYANKGVTLIAVQDAFNMEVKCSLHVHQEEWLWLSADEDRDGVENAYELPPIPATVCYLRGRNEHRWAAAVGRYDGSGFDDETRMIPIRVRVINSLAESCSNLEATASGRRRALKSGMFVNVKMQVPTGTAFLRIPPKAVRPGNVVWTCRDGRLRRHRVKPVAALDAHVLLMESQTLIRSGDSVVVSPLLWPTEGQEYLIAEGSPQ